MEDQRELSGETIVSIKDATKDSEKEKDSLPTPSLHLQKLNNNLLSYKEKEKAIVNRPLEKVWDDVATRMTEMAKL